MQSGISKLKARADQRRQRSLKQQRQAGIEAKANTRAESKLESDPEKSKKPKSKSKSRSEASNGVAADIDLRENRKRERDLDVGVSSSVDRNGAGARRSKTAHVVGEESDSGHMGATSTLGKDAVAATVSETVTSSAPAGEMVQTVPSFVFQIKVPKKARRTVIDAIESYPKRKRSRSRNRTERDDYSERDNDSAALSSTSKRARKQTGAEKGADTGSAQLRSRSGSPQTRIRREDEGRHRSTRASLLQSEHQRTQSQSRSRSSTRSTSVSQADRAGAAGGANTNASANHRGPSSRERVSKSIPRLSAGEIERLKRRSGFLEENIRSFKHMGDAERETGGKTALEVVYYTESLVCCTESFFMMWPFTPLVEMHKNWQTMRNVCDYVYKKCVNNGSSFGIIQGCVAMTLACMNYQLSLVSLEADGLGNVAQYISDMAAYETEARRRLSPYNLATQLPQLWRRCQENTSRVLGQFERRSEPYTRDWSSVPTVYPLGATSSPLDVANFVRQASREWLSQAGLELRMPGEK
ncbi:hypothetical protein GGI07_005014 [Coemansia sp. Benny D115]|nr:hypothetical protein GGI07_005014 [Coemansia sp. Benny D115]